MKIKHVRMYQLLWVIQITLYMTPDRLEFEISFKHTQIKELPVFAIW